MQRPSSEASNPEHRIYFFINIRWHDDFGFITDKPCDVDSTDKRSLFAAWVLAGLGIPYAAGEDADVDTGRTCRAAQGTCAEAGPGEEEEEEEEEVE